MTEFDSNAVDDTAANASTADERTPRMLRSPCPSSTSRTRSTGSAPRRSTTRRPRRARTRPGHGRRPNWRRVRAAESDSRGRAADADAEPVALDPVEELRAELRRAPGDWFVVHSYAGYENKVKTNLESRISSLDMEDYIFQVEVPTEEVVEIKNGKRQQVNRKVFPGYILVRMDLTDDSWGAVRNTPGVTGFVGATSKPSPLSMDEVLKILAPTVQKPGTAGKSGTAGGTDTSAVLRPRWWISRSASR